MLWNVFHDQFNSSLYDVYTSVMVSYVFIIIMVLVNLMKSRTAFFFSPKYQKKIKHILGLLIPFQ